MKFTVKNLGKIKKANIELKPLTIFVGKNGTQKSYMAHVAYGLNKFLGLPIRVVLAKAIEKSLINMFGKDIKQKDKIYLSKKQVKQIVLEVIPAIEKFLNNEIKKNFNSENNFKELKVELEINLERDLYNDIEEKTTVDLIQIDEDIYEQEIQKAFSLIKSRIISLILRDIIGINHVPRVYYFPASRTGFVLAFNEIATGIFEHYEGTTTTKLTKPVIDFLSNFMRIKTSDSSLEGILSLAKSFYKKGNKNDHKNANLISFLQERILRGKILEKKEENKYLNFMFKPFGSEEELELHVTSSATVELLPIIEFLKNFHPSKNGFFIIEEPEAHLHPKAQIEMARFLALLANSGINVLITTHSDYIIHEMSNCIKLFNLEEKYRKEFFKKEDLEDYTDIAISQDKVSVYLFKEDEKNVEVEKLNVDKFGIEDKNFEDVIDELFERSTLLGERLIESSKYNKDS